MKNLLLFISLLLATAADLQADAPSGVSVSYQLPTVGVLPQTYCVTLAIVDAKNPDWIVSQFACGTARTVTVENGGKFNEVWDGLDDNFMPVPPGEYAVKGIFMPARQWPVDNEWHSVTPKFVTGISSWLPSPDDWKTPEPFGGDPVSAPLGDLAVGPNGVAVFYYSYLENGLNNPMFDLKQPVGYGQFIRAFNSGGAGGGNATATEGESVWSFCNEGGMKYVYRADGKSFGTSHGANRSNGYLPQGWVTSMAAWRDGEHPFVAVAQRGKIVNSEEHKDQFVESKTEFVDKITLHDGDDGNILAELPLERPQSVTVQRGLLFALHTVGPEYVVSAIGVGAGAAKGDWKPVFTLPSNIHPFDMEVDSRGRFYISDEASNHVYQLDRTGKVLRTFGKLPVQHSGTYDPQTLMAPGKLATWLDPDGNDRLLILENAGPNRVAEWSADGKLLREFLSLQTMANEGYAVDPDHPELLYVPGQQNWLTRFRVDYETRKLSVDATWPFANDPRAAGLRKPKLIRAGGRIYFACAGGAREGAYNVYRLADDGLKLSASIIQVRDDARQPPTYYFWHDANDNGRVDDEEMTPTKLPGNVFTYHGQNWSDDFAFLAMNQDGQDVWQVLPTGFDAHGNPIFKEWKKLLTDPIFAARAAGTVDAIHGGNELTQKFDSDWMQTDGTDADGYYVQARGGKNFSANEGPQHKISRYVPDGSGGYQLKWRTGRTALQRNALPGEVYGAMRIRKPINGLLSVIDQSRCGVLLYTADGLYVDTVFLDGRKFSTSNAGLYPLPGEFFVGDLFGNRTNGKIYFAMGKHTPLLFEAEGWSLTSNPVRPLTTVQSMVTISAAQIASPPEIALTVRGGAGSAKFAHITPAIGEVAFDGSMSGWESSDPVLFQASKDQTIEVRCLYRPDELLLRWHARMATKFEPKPLPPLPRIFTHEQLADTLSFYIQGNVNAQPTDLSKGNSVGRPGDVRFVFGVFEKDAKSQAIAVGMYPQWSGNSSPSPQVYRTPVGSANFAHVGANENARLAHKVDDDQKGFVFVAAIPRAAISEMKQPFTGGLRTLVNFEATFSGHNKFWWANTDGSASRETFDEPTEARLYPGSWAMADFQGLDNGIVIRNWQLIGPFGGPGAERFKDDPNGLILGTNIEMKKAVQEMYESTKFPLDDVAAVDLKAEFTGEQIRGYWNDPQRVIWKPATIEPLDVRMIVGGGGQVRYGATWIHVPAAMEINFEFHSHPMTELRWLVNGEAIPLKSSEYKAVDPSLDQIALLPIKLRAGWNEVRFRGYGYGYSPFRVGLVLKGPEEDLWKLRLADHPPVE